MSARWWTFVTSFLLAASAVFWGLRLFVKAPGMPPDTVVAAAGPIGQGDLTRLLGVDAPPPSAAVVAEPPPDARFQLIGVVAPRAPEAANEGLALIAVDGKLPRAYRVGAAVDGLTVLQSVAARGAELGPRDGAAQIRLKLMVPPAATTGTLPTTIGGIVPGVPEQPAALAAGSNLTPSGLPAPGLRRPPGPVHQRVDPPGTGPRAEAATSR